MNKTQDTLYLVMKAALNKGWHIQTRANRHLNPSAEYISQTGRRVMRRNDSDLVDLFSGDENKED